MAPLPSTLGDGGHGGRPWWPGKPWPRSTTCQPGLCVSPPPSPPPPPGEQLLYQIPNNKVLTTKIGLLSALREYSRVVSKTHKISPCAQAR